MKNLKLLSLFLVLVMAISVFAGCAKPEVAAPAAGAAAPAAAKKLVVGVSMQGLDAPYVVSVKKHVEAALAAAGVDAIVLDGEAKAEKQVSQVENFIAQKVDAIILNPIAYDGCAPAVDAANKAGIPIVTLITRVANQDKANSFVGSDHKDSGIIEAEMVAKDMGGKGNIVVIEGVMGIDAQIQRMEGYKEVLAKYPDIKIVAQQAANWQRSEAFAITENWIKSGKKFDVVLSQNDNMALGALRAVEQANLVSKIKVFGIDGDKDALEAVKAGRLAGTVFQDAKRQAERAVECAIKLTKGEPIEKYYVIPFKAVTEENADKFLIQ
jgi:inositol transport system substrate-binding protein